MTSELLGAHIPPEGIDDPSVVGLRLLIKHTVPLDVFLFLEGMAREEGKQLDDIYLRIVNTAIIETMRKSVADRVANARIQAAMAATPKPGPKPKKAGTKPVSKVKPPQAAKPKAAAKPAKTVPLKPAKAKGNGKTKTNGKTHVKAQPAAPARKAPKKAAKKSQAAKKAPAAIAQPAPKAAAKAPAGPHIIKRTPHPRVKGTE
jgi:hypothetical protein